MSMETIYLGIVIFLFVLAIFDLVVGVSNDAVNFLQSAVGAKAASFKLYKIQDQMKGKKGLRIRVKTLYNGEKFYEVKFPSSN